MIEETTEATHTSFNNIKERQEELSGTVTNLLKVLCKVVEDVKIVVDCPNETTESQDPSETSRMEQTAPPFPVPPITVEVSKAIVDLGTLEFNDVFKDNGKIIIDLSSMHINEVYPV